MEEKGQILDIHDVALHPQYEQQAYQDIAVVTLETSNCKFKIKCPYHIKRYNNELDS